MELKTIHSDDRGSINLLVGDFDELQEVTVFKTKAGYARGGCVHNVNDEFVCVLEGRIEYYTTELKSPVVMTSGHSTVIRKGTPHYFISITESVVMEWGASPEEKKNKHAEFRKIVDEHNSKKIASDML